MLGYVVRRLAASVLIVAGVSVLVFLSLHLTPGDPAALIAGPHADEREIRLIRERFNLDDPLPVQYGRWAQRMVRGDFGVSYRTGLPVARDLTGAFPVSLSLAVGGLALATVVGIPAGVVAAIRRGGPLDLAVMGLSVAGISLPSFWVALLLVLLFSLQLRWLPSGGWGGLQHYILPVVALSLGSIALIARMTRSVMVEVLLEDYVRTARAKGLAEAAVLTRHALRNAMLPVVTVMGLRFGLLVAGAVVIETVFAVPGIGRMIVQGVATRDFPVVQGGVLLVAAAVSLINLGVDLAYALLDPRIRYGA